eukprot:gene8221-1487_t
MEEDRQDVLMNFLAITNADDAKALPILEASNWKLDDAVNLFFAAGEGGGAMGGGAPSNPAAPSNMGGMEEDYVRAALPSKVDRLYGHARGPMPAGAQFGLSQQRQPPKDLLFDGDFEAAKAHASEEGKWLLLNVQCATEFDSCRLNRDTWGHPALKEMLIGMFVFYQQDMENEEGAKLVTNYRLSKLPAVLVVDPITGATITDKSGFMDAEKMMDMLVPFMDQGPKDPGAGRLAHAMSMKRKATADAAASASRPTTVIEGFDDEDAEMARAIAASMEPQTAGATSVEGPSNAMDDSLDDIDEEEVWARIREDEAKEEAARNKPSAEQVLAEAQKRLPEEPPEATGSGPKSVCRVACRMPDGQRLTRRFNKSDTVQAIMDYCVCQLPEAAAGRKFGLHIAMGGGQLSTPEATLEAAGVEGTLISVKWEE